MKCNLNVNRTVAPRADLGNVDILSFTRPDMKPEDSREGRLTNINEENGCNKGDEDVPEEGIMMEKATVRRTSEFYAK